MCNFRIGQEVVCINAKGTTTRDLEISSGLKENKIYSITQLYQSPCCGIICVGVGIIKPHGVSNMSICVCGGTNTDNNTEWTFLHTRFAPLQTDSEEADMNEALAEISQREIFEVK